MTFSARNLRLVVVHPGGAHKDDLLAVCVLVAESGAPVERREPTLAELEDPTVAVVDIGGRHEPALGNFDHHQLPREHAPTCSLSLVLEALGLYEDARSLCDWLEVLEWFDSRGPQRTAEWLGVSRELLSRLNSPIDLALLRLFGAGQQWGADAPLHETLRGVGAELVSFLRGARARQSYLESRVAFWELDLDGEAVQVAFLPREAETLEDPSDGLARFVLGRGLGGKVVAMAYPDQRASGYGLARFQDHPRMDFGRVELEADVHFAHKSGFMCKTSATEPERLRQLVAQAWR